MYGCQHSAALYLLRWGNIVYIVYIVMDIYIYICIYYTSSGEEILYILWWIFIFVYLYLYMYILYLLRWEDIAFYFWSKVEEIEFHGLLGVGHIQRHHFRRLSMVFISDHPWLIIYNVLSIHGWSKVKPVKNDDVIHEQPLIRPA